MRNFKITSKGWLTGIAGVCALTFLLSSCLKDNHNTYYNNPPVALLLITQASPDAPAADFYLDNDRVNGAAIDYGSTIPYIRAYTGNRNAIFYKSGTLNKIASDTIHLSNQINYSLFLANSITKPDFILLTDSISQPSAGNASIRFVNVSSDAPAVDLAVSGGSILASNKAYKGYSSFLPLKGNMSYSFQINQTGTSTALATMTNIMIQSGFVYTIWLHGFVSGSGNTKVTADIMTNAYYYQ